MDANFEAKSPAKAAVKVFRLLEQNGLTMLLNIVLTVDIRSALSLSWIMKAKVYAITESYDFDLR